MQILYCSFTVTNPITPMPRRSKKPGQPTVPTPVSVPGIAAEVIAFYAAGSLQLAALYALDQAAQQRTAPTERTTTYDPPANPYRKSPRRN